MNRFSRFLFELTILLVVFTLPTTAQLGSAGTINLDTVKSSPRDIGKMWTFEDAPVEVWQKAYNFTPTDEWLENIRMSSPKFATWCSSGFVSEDGLLITNHHCVDFILNRVQQPGEDIPKNGFYAKTLEEERRVPGLFVDQMVMIKDVTEEIVDAINSGKTEEEKLQNKIDKIAEVEERYSKGTGLRCTITSLYNGGKYSLYGNKRYDDVRFVLSNERIVGLYGGDPDNYTYPRYNADFAILRVYDENGKPLKTPNHFKFNINGPDLNDVMFAIGTPGRTNRLKTVAQLEYNRDYLYAPTVSVLERLIKIYEEMIVENPGKAAVYQGAMFGPANTAKRWGGFLRNLSDPYLMARKKDFEKEFKNAVMSNPDNAEKYGHIWDAIANSRAELSKIANAITAYNINLRFASQYFVIATRLVNLANEMKLPMGKRDKAYAGVELQNTIDNIFPAGFDKELEYKRLALQVDFITELLGEDNELVKKYFHNKKGFDAADYILGLTRLNQKKAVEDFALMNPDDILNSGDPVIGFIAESRPILDELLAKQKEILDTEQTLEDQLGIALFKVYGTTIPPDATGTLRITDGVMKTYDYNGTIAPKITTFYGMYDRYYSHEKKWPWDLPERWVNYGPGFDLSAQCNFQGTFDTAGGSSGSPITNTRGEYVGIIHDGNIEGLSGDFIYTSDNKRSLAMSSQGMYEIVKDLYGAERIAKELETGKIAE